MNSAMEYAAMPDAWDYIKDYVHRSSDNAFDNLNNYEGAADRFTFYLDGIDQRANFFGASHLYQQNVGAGVQWFGGAEYVSRAHLTGLGADGSASQYTFALGSLLGGVWPVYDWRAAAGDALMNGGFATFRNLYNSGTNNPVAWDVAQLRNEQKLLQPIHEEYLSGFWLGLFRGASNIATNSDYLGLTSLAGLEQKQTMPGGVEILDYESRINYGCKLLGLHGQSACSP